MFASKKMRLGGSYIISPVRSLDYKSCHYGITIAFLFVVSSDKQVIVKSYLQLDKKSLNSIREIKRKLVLLSMQKTS